MFNIVLFGAPGSGKGTQSERLIDRYGLLHISTGEVLRDHIARGTELGRIADSYISKGNLIPDDLMVRILADVLDSNPDAERGVIFDGFPRTIQQAEALENMLAGRGTRLHAVVGLEVPEEELTERLLRRGLESGRSDDNIDTIRKRIQVYHSQTEPIRKFYIEKGNYHSINGSGDIDAITRDIVSCLDKLC